jgi:CheY-like chemotaxis protein
LALVPQNSRIAFFHLHGYPSVSLIEKYRKTCIYHHRFVMPEPDARIDHSPGVIINISGTMTTNSAVPSYLREKTKILVVEDNPLNQKLDSFLFDNWGLSYQMCSNGVHAIAYLKDSTYDLVLMDLRLPELDGYETARIIREEMKLQVPIIGITAYATEEEKARCLSVGMNNYISKPVDEQELLSIILFYLTPVAAEMVAVK